MIYRLSSTDRAVRIDIGNYWDRSAVLVILNPRLIAGSWVGEPPLNQAEIGWEEFVNYEATGPLPDGVDGSLDIRASLGTATARLTFTNNSSSRIAAFNSNPAPYDGTWEGQRVTLGAKPTSNRLNVSLYIGNQQPPVLSNFEPIFDD